MLTLPGSRALSRFRLIRLLARLRAVTPLITALDAQYLHFVETRRALDPAEQTRLLQLLDDGGETVDSDRGVPLGRLAGSTPPRHHLALVEQSH